MRALCEIPSEMVGMMSYGKRGSRLDSLQRKFSVIISIEGRTAVIYGANEKCCRDAQSYMRNMVRNMVWNSLTSKALLKSAAEKVKSMYPFVGICVNPITGDHTLTFKDEVLCKRVTREFEAIVRDSKVTLPLLAMYFLLLYALYMFCSYQRFNDLFLFGCSFGVLYWCYSPDAIRTQAISAASEVQKKYPALAISVDPDTCKLTVECSNKTANDFNAIMQSMVPDGIRAAIEVHNRYQSVQIYVDPNTCDTIITCNDEVLRKCAAEEFEGIVRLGTSPAMQRTFPSKCGQSSAVGYSKPSMGSASSSMVSAAISAKYPSDTFSNASNSCFLLKSNEAKILGIKRKWEASGGDPSVIINSWQICNPSLNNIFRNTEKLPGDMITGWHGSANANIASICSGGFDPSKRVRAAYGDGDYFAKDPKVACQYSGDGSFLFMCHLHFLENEQQEWIEDMGYYVMNMSKKSGGNTRMQVLPVQLIQFKPFNPRTNDELILDKVLRDTRDGTSQRGVLHGKQWGAANPTIMTSSPEIPTKAVSHLFFGWLNPRYSSERLIQSVKDHFKFVKLPISEVVVNQNGLRQGVSIKLYFPINPKLFCKAAALKYEGYKVTLLPLATAPIPQRCPKLFKGYCRGWNLRGHSDWTAPCWYDHPVDRMFPQRGYTTKPLENGAKRESIIRELQRSVPNATYIEIDVVINEELKERYAARMDYIRGKHPTVVEQELWHGTSPGALDTILSRGFQPPSDTAASKRCPNYIKGITTTLCSNHCTYCTKPHEHNMCHMYGLGVYFADAAQKSERYCQAVAGRYSQLYCRVNLGSPCLLRGNLLEPDAMHHVYSCVDPENYLDRVVQPYNSTTRHETYHVDGLGMEGHTYGHSVINSEYVIFTPSHAMATYVVTYSKW